MQPVLFKKSDRAESPGDARCPRACGGVPKGQAGRLRARHLVLAHAGCSEPSDLGRGDHLVVRAGVFRTRSAARPKILARPWSPPARAT